MTRVRIIVLNYNGEDLLPKCLPSIVEASRKSSFPTKVAVLDNRSEDKGLDYVKREHPEVEIVTAPENKVLCSYNDYVRTVSEPIVILLNNDIRVDPHFVDPLVQKFANDPSAFMAAPKVMDYAGIRVEAARSKSGMRFGMFYCEGRYPGYEQEWDQPSETDNSGFAAFDREKFVSLGGYDERYHPGIMEDVDLCYRAKKTGWHLHYEPASVVYHVGQASFKKKFGQTKMSMIAHRNTFLFMWKNFRGFPFWAQHLTFLPLRLVYAALSGNFTMVSGFFAALRHPKR